MHTWVGVRALYERVCASYRCLHLTDDHCSIMYHNVAFVYHEILPLKYKLTRSQAKTCNIIRHTRIDSFLTNLYCIYALQIEQCWRLHPIGWKRRMRSYIIIIRRCHNSIKLNLIGKLKRQHKRLCQNPKMLFFLALYHQNV